MKLITFPMNCKLEWSNWKMLLRFNTKLISYAKSCEGGYLGVLLPCLQYYVVLLNWKYIIIIIIIIIICIGMKDKEMK